MAIAVAPALRARLAEHRDEAGSIPSPRRAVLEHLARWIAGRLAAGEPVRLVFVCTHNSRRSHLAAAWAWAAAADLGLGAVESLSAGTEVTAVHPNVVETLARAGFVVERGAGENPVHRLRLGPGGTALQMFSKTLGHPSLPRDGFCAVMTCTDADAGCPVVAGAATRVALPYEDPKAADGTPEAAAVYEARSTEVARQMVWVMGRVKSEKERVESLSPRDVGPSGS